VRFSFWHWVIQVCRLETLTFLVGGVECDMPMSMPGRRIGERVPGRRSVEVTKATLCDIRVSSLDGLQDYKQQKLPFRPIRRYICILPTLLADISFYTWMNANCRSGMPLFKSSG